jgi:hypothetical protein
MKTPTFQRPHLPQIFYPQFISRMVYIRDRFPMNGFRGSSDRYVTTHYIIIIIIFLLNKKSQNHLNGLGFGFVVLFFILKQKKPKTIQKK